MNATPYVVLLAEDEPADVELVRRALALSALPFALHHVADGRSALAYLARKEPRHKDAPRPHLILLDLNMPYMNGGQFLQAIKQDDALRGIPVLVMTASETERDAHIAHLLGADAFISKSIDATAFMAEVRQLCERWIACRVAASGKASGGA